MSKITFDELRKKGFHSRRRCRRRAVRPEIAPFSHQILDSTEGKKPYHTLTGRQQFYMDQDWFLQEGEALPTYKRRR